MNRISPVQAGVTLGALFAAMHATWIVLVAAGLGDTAFTLLTGAHFVSVEYTIVALDPVATVTGIVGAFVSGLAIGGLFAAIWNTVGDGLQ